VCTGASWRQEAHRQPILIGTDAEEIQQHITSRRQHRPEETEKGNEYSSEILHHGTCSCLVRDQLTVSCLMDHPIWIRSPTNLAAAGSGGLRRRSFGRWAVMAARLCIHRRHPAPGVRDGGMAVWTGRRRRCTAAECLSASGGGVEKRTRGERGDTVAELYVNAVLCPTISTSPGSRKNKTRVGAGFNLPNRSLKPPAVGFGKPVGKLRLPLKTDQIQIPN
jgi:hypothetical protein